MLRDLLSSQGGWRGGPGLAGSDGGEQLDAHGVGFMTSLRCRERCAGRGWGARRCCATCARGPRSRGCRAFFCFSFLPPVPSPQALSLLLLLGLGRESPSQAVSTGRAPCILSNAPATELGHSVTSSLTSLSGARSPPANTSGMMLLLTGTPSSLGPSGKVTSQSVLAPPTFKLPPPHAHADPSPVHKSDRSPDRSPIHKSDSCPPVRKPVHESVQEPVHESVHGSDHFADDDALVFLIPWIRQHHARDHDVAVPLVWTTVAPEPLVASRAFPPSNQSSFH